MNDQTGMLTPQQYQDQVAARNGLNQRLGSSSMHYEMGAENPNADKKGKSTSILLINIAFVAILAAGIGGSFVEFFDMDKFVSFLEVFGYIWAPLIVAVGGGRAFKNFTEKKYLANKNQQPMDITQPPV